VNKIQKYLSYLWDIRIEERTSQYNSDLIVLLSKGRYQLCTVDAIYSHEEKYYNFKYILENQINYDLLEGRKALILGMGMASIPIILDNLHPGKWSITGVEIDEVIIELASRYTFPRIKSSLQTIATDAASYVKISEESFDVICVDVFIGQDTPDQFRTHEFLNATKKMLSSKGVLIYNTIAFTNDNLELAKIFFNSTFREVFPEGRAVNAHRNLMLLNT